MLANIQIFSWYSGLKKNNNKKNIYMYDGTVLFHTLPSLFKRDWYFFFNFVGEMFCFYFFSYFHRSIHCILHQNLLPIGWSFQPYITCPAVSIYVLNKKCPETIQRGLLNLKGDMWNRLELWWHLICIKTKYIFYRTELTQLQQIGIHFLFAILRCMAQSHWI